MTRWDERFRKGEYSQDPDPSPVLERYVESFPDGRAHDVATRTGHNAVFLVGKGYEIDAIDNSRVDLEIADRTPRSQHGGADQLDLRGHPWLSGLRSPTTC